MAGLQKSRENIKNFNSIYMEKSTEKCTKPDCDCLEIAEQKAGGQVKSYPCLASHTEFTKEKSSKTEKSKLETLISELRVEEENAFGLAMQSIKDLDFNLHYGFKGKSEALSLCIQKLNSICEHLNKNIKCQCDNEIKTGQTSVMCCNICGKPDEDFWNMGEAESMEQGMIEKDLELESLKLYSEETSKRWSQGQQQIKLMRSVIDKLINESKPKYSEAEKLIIKDSIDRRFGKSC